jgi:two-component system C4-dicarboxylate transport sensor histidine kinase DctB
VHRDAQRERVDIGSVIDAVLTLAAPTASRSGVALLVERSGAVWVMGDPVQLQQALLNLVLNGIEAMQETVGERRLEIDLGQRGHDIVIGVADRGPGIDAALEGHLFDWCFTTKKDGLGLGLPTAQMLINAHGGRILVANRPDGGTRVEICLPRG